MRAALALTITFFTAVLGAACGSDDSNGSPATQPEEWNCSERPSLPNHCSCNPYVVFGEAVPITTCNEGTVGQNPICCHRPDTDECICNSLQCETTSSGCVCSSFATGGTPTASCTGAYCCQANDDASCRCGDQPCGEGTTAIATCDYASVGCGQNRQKMTDCSVNPKTL